MSANRQRPTSTPTLFLTHARLRQYGVSSGDLRRGVPPGALTWPLRGQIRTQLALPLTEAGFRERTPIVVRESRNPAGFELTGLAEPVRVPRSRPARDDSIASSERSA